MAKLSQIAKGTRARKELSFALLDGTEVTAAIRPLDGDDHADILAAATASMPSGVEAKEGVPAFDFAIAGETLARAFIDPESPHEKPEPFFDEGVQQVRARLDRDRIFWLLEQQKAFQASLSPLKQALSPDEFFAAIVQIAESEEGQDTLPFATWAPDLRVSFIRTLASLLLSSQMDRSSTGSGEETAPSPS